MKHVYKNVGSKHRQDASLRQANSGKLVLSKDEKADEKSDQKLSPRKQSYDREHHQQKRARETIPESQQADRERHQQKLVQEITPERQHAGRPIDSVVNTSEYKK